MPGSTGHCPFPPDRSPSNQRPVPTATWVFSGGKWAGRPYPLPKRRGFGYTILAEVIPFEVDGISTPEFLPSGFTLAIELPAATAECVSAAAPPPDASGVMEDIPDSGMLARLLAVSLVVEDNLFIALDVEDMLRKLGAVRVDIAKSVGEAIELIDQRSYSFALLDVKLGMDNSLPVARALLPRTRGWYLAPVMARRTRWMPRWRRSRSCRNPIIRNHSPGCCRGCLHPPVIWRGNDEIGFAG